MPEPPILSVASEGERDRGVVPEVIGARHGGRRWCSVRGRWTPPVVVARMVPPCPTVQAWSASVQATEKRRACSGILRRPRDATVGGGEDGPVPAYRPAVTVVGESDAG